MATTSPDNIRTPDPGDAYNLVPDLANLAGDVQAALNLRANMYSGTGAQRVAALSPLSPGTFWADTDGQLAIWQKVSGAWVRVFQQGVITSIWTPGSGRAVTTGYYSINRRLLTFSLQITGHVVTPSIDGTFNAGYRPQVDSYVSAGDNSGNLGWARIGTAGETSSLTPSAPTNLHYFGSFTLPA